MFSPIVKSTLSGISSALRCKPPLRIMQDGRSATFGCPGIPTTLVIFGPAFLVHGLPSKMCRHNASSLAYGFNALSSRVKGLSSTFAGFGCRSLSLRMNENSFSASLGLVNKVDEPALGNQDKAQITAQIAELQKFLQLLADEGATAWCTPTFSLQDKQATSCVLYSLNTLVHRWFPQYGCALLKMPSVVGHVRLELLCPDGWNFAPHSGPLGVEFASTPTKFASPLPVGELSEDLLHMFDSEVEVRMSELMAITGDARNAAKNKESHQRTPACIRSLLQNAMTTVKNAGNGVAHISIVMKDRELQKQHDRPPVGGFTDVGLHTGGKQRHTTWPLVLAVVHAAIHNILPLHSEAYPQRGALFYQLLASFYLWLVETDLGLASSHDDLANKGSFSHEYATSEKINEVHVLLRESVKIATSLEDDGVELHDFATRCERARVRLEALRASRAHYQAAALSFPDLNAYISSSPWICPQVQVQSSGVPKKDARGLEHLRERAARNVEWVYVSPYYGKVNICGTYAWLKEHLNPLYAGRLLLATVSQLHMKTVEDLMFSLAQTGFDKLQVSEQEAHDMVQIVHLYRDLSKTLIKTQKAQGRMQTGIMGLRVLVQFIAFCVVHRACTIHEPVIHSYGIGLDWKDFDHLVLEDPKALRCLLQVSMYIKAHTKSTKIFSLLPTGNEDTLSLARTVCKQGRHASTFAELLKLEQSRAALREQAYWSKVKEQTNEVCQLRDKIESLNREKTVLESELSLPQKKDKLQQIESQIKSSVGKIKNAERSLKGKKQSPRPLLQNLPKDNDLAYEVLFFMDMPPLFQDLSEMSFACQEALLPPLTGQARKDQPNFFPCDGWEMKMFIEVPEPEADWVNIYTYKGYLHVSANKASAGSRNLKLISLESVPARCGPALVEEITHASNGIWYPDKLSRSMVWLSGGTYMNPFVKLENSWRTLAHTEKLPDTYANLQWAVPLLSDYPTRDNWGHAAQDTKPVAFTKREFLSFADLRANPNLQLRKLCHMIRDRSLPLHIPFVHLVVRQALYQTGPISSEDHVNKLWQSTCIPDVKKDLGDQDFMNTFLSELENFADEIKDRVMDHPSLLIAGQISAYMSGFDQRFVELRRKLAQCAIGWGENLESEKLYAEAEYHAGLRAKQRAFYLYAVMCYGAGPLDDVTDIRLMLRALVKSKNGPVSGDATELDALIENLTVCVHDIMSMRLPDFIKVLNQADNSCILTDTVNSVVPVKGTLNWQAVKRSQTGSTADAQSCCFEGLPSADGPLYTINILTGMVLYDGNPLQGLPHSVLKNALYIKTFGACNFEVVLSASGSYKTSNKVDGVYDYEFSTTDQHDLVVIETDTRTEKRLELIKQMSCLPGADVPIRLRAMHSHWLCREDQVIVFRGINFRMRNPSFIMIRQQQDSVSDEWICFKSPENTCKDDEEIKKQDKCWTKLVQERHDLDRLVVLQRPGVSIAEPSHNSVHASLSTPPSVSAAHEVLNILSKFEQVDLIHVLRKAHSDHVCFEMPRYKLEFELRDGKLMSLNYLDYCLASTQQLTDTLHEFNNYLVLELKRPLDPEGRPAVKVLVPEGEVMRNGGESVVTIKGPSECDANRALFTYNVHPRFCNLEAQGIQARLHLAALYAATSTLLPESRTSMTGAEHAIELVRQSWKNTPLTDDEVTKLQGVVNHCHSSATLALVCADLERSAQALRMLHAVDHTVAGSGLTPTAKVSVGQNSGQMCQLHFPHEESWTCGYNTAAGCNAVEDYVAAYRVQRSGALHNVRCALTPEEERNMLGTCRSVPLTTKGIHFIHHEGDGGVRDMTTTKHAVEQQDVHDAFEFVKCCELLFMRIGGTHTSSTEAWSHSSKLSQLCAESGVMHWLNMHTTHGTNAMNAALMNDIGAATSNNTLHSHDSDPSSDQGLKQEVSNKTFPLACITQHAVLDSSRGRDMMNELERSWHAYCTSQTRGNDFAWDKHTSSLTSLLDSLQVAVSTMREDMEERIYVHIQGDSVHADSGVALRDKSMDHDSRHDSGVASRKLRMLRACNLMPKPGARDLLRMLVKHDTIRCFDPLLHDDDDDDHVDVNNDSNSVRALKRRIAAWSLLCVLDDKITRMRAWLYVDDEALRMQYRQFVINELRVWREWNAEDHPEWVVLEVEGRLQIRPKQYHIALQMINAKSDCGAVFQLNMGEGKTRVVLPMVWTYMSRDRKSLVRANFISTLLREAKEHLELHTSASVLYKRLYMLPFHRDVELELLDISRMRECLAQCQRTGGLLIVAPEHRNSLSLKAKEWHFSGKAKHVQALDAMHDEFAWFDILDECDVILHHNYQLVYAYGLPCALPDAERRWMAVEAICRIIDQDDNVRSILAPPHISKRLESKHSTSSSPSSSFTPVRLIPSDELDAIVPSLLHAIASSLVKHPPYRWQWIQRTQANHEELIRVMTDKSVDAHSIFAGTLSILDGQQKADVLAFRGLLANGIIVHCLKKRFRVEYGLKEGGKKRMAVPYRASDSPSERSEFSQPECALVQTYLSYYYDGLSDEYVREAMRMLMTIGEEARKHHYGTWYELSKADMKEEHRVKLDSVAKIDLSNAEQMDLACAYFKGNRETINFFLGKCVLPQDTQQYKHRLVSSAWDLASNNDKGHTTGFSGTKDLHMLLPKQVELADAMDDELRGTDGKMIALIMRNNDIIELPPSAQDSEPEWKRVVRECVMRHVGALIDAGAVLAGVSNRQVALYILTMLGTSEYRGVTFFDTDMHTWRIRARDGQEWHKSSSPIPERDTFALFDESRCRGADLKLAQNAVGMVTIGAKMCKDKLMQAAGRMRRLVEGQKLVFVIPSDIALQIRRTSDEKKGTRDSFNVEALRLSEIDSKLDVLRLLEWVTRNTVQATVDGMVSYTEKGGIYATTRESRDKSCLPEILELDDIYSAPIKTQSTYDIIHRQLGALAQRCSDVVASGKAKRLLDMIRETADKYGREFHREASVLDEECERELEREEEEEQKQERQACRAVPRHHLQWNVVQLIGAKSLKEVSAHGGPSSLIGTLSQYLDKYVKTQDVRTRDGRGSIDRVEAIKWPDNFFCTENFFVTVVSLCQDARHWVDVRNTHDGTGVVSCLNEFLRPAYFAWRTPDGEVVLLSGKEADELLTSLRCMVPSSAGARFGLHFLSYATDRGAASLRLLVPSRASAEDDADALDDDVSAAVQVYNGKTSMIDDARCKSVAALLRCDDSSRTCDRDSHNAPTNPPKSPIMNHDNLQVDDDAAARAAVDLAIIHGLSHTLELSDLERIVGHHSVYAVVSQAQDAQMQAAK